jgi:hypothetical protein
VPEEFHVRDLPREDGEHFAASYRRLAEAGFAPQIIDSSSVLVTPRHRTLSEWLKTQPSADEMALMAHRIIELLRGVHALGACHRDVHVDNIVLTKDLTPLLIDPHFMIESDPDKPCYDLFGPDVSGVPVPQAHVMQGGVAAQGVWWDAPVQVRELGPIFGRIDSLIDAED